MVYGGEEYQLHSSVLHIGNSANSGHYVTYYFNNKSVYKFDDHAGGRPAGYYSVTADAYDKVEGTEYIFLYKKKDTSENEVAELQVLDSDNLQPTAVTSPPREGEQQTKIQQPASVGEEINNVQSLMVTSPPRSTAQLSQKETIELDTQSQPKTPGKPIDYETLQTLLSDIKESIVQEVWKANTPSQHSQHSNQSMSPVFNSQSSMVPGVQRSLQRAFSEVADNQENNMPVIPEETDEEVSFFEGSLPQIFYVGDYGQDQWIKERVWHFFVLVEKTMALQFRVDYDVELR